MNPTKRLPPQVAPPALRLLERPPRPAERPATPVRPGVWRRVAEALRLPRW